MVQPGDIVLHSGNDFYARAIQWGTHSKWSHAAVVVDVNPTGPVVIEATQQGLKKTQIFSTDTNWQFRDSGQTPGERKDAVLWTLRKYALGEKYNFFDIFFISVHILLPWWKLVVEGTGRYYCSELVACSEIHGGADIDAPELTSPADLDRLYPVLA